MLSSFINRRKGKKISLFDATLRRVPLPPSPSCFGTSGSLEPLNNYSQTASSSRRPPNPLNSNQAVRTPPQVQLDFQTGDDWFSRVGAQERRPDNAHADKPSKHTIRTSDDVHLIQDQPNQSQPSLTLNTSSPLSSPYLPNYPPTNSTDLLDCGDHLPLAGVTRKPAPTPLKIPNHPAKVQLARSASVGASEKKTNVVSPNSNNGLGPSRPTSYISSEDMSSVSGTTLARALLANTFIIPPSDNLRLRYRSGGTTQQDSATLPKGDHPLMSPHSKDKRISGGEASQSGRNSVVPPVPPLPPNIDDLGKRDSTYLKRSSSTSVRRQIVEGPQDLKHLSSQDRHSLQRRVSRISEASTPVVSVPDTPERKGGQTSVIGSALGSDSLLTGMSKGTARTENSGFSDMAPTSAGSADDIDNVLSGFQFSPLKSPFPVYLNSDNPPSHQSSGANPTFGSKSSNGSSRRSTQTSMKGKQLDFKSLSEPGTTKVHHGSHNSSLRPQTLLPIGERPRSLHVPTTPVSRESNSSSIQSVSPSIGSPDLLDMFLQSSASSTLSHPKIIGIGTVPELDLDGSIPSASEEFYHQTFPETPAAFSPLWSGLSPMYQKPSAGSNEQDYPGLPRSTSIRGDRSRIPPKRTASLSNVMLTRIPPSSAKPQMSPIPATPQNDCSLDGSFGTTAGDNNFSDGRSAHPSSADINGTTSESTPLTSNSGSSVERSINTTTASSPDARSVDDRENAEIDRDLRRSSVVSGNTFGSYRASANSSTAELPSTVNSNSTKRGKIRALPKYPKPVPIAVPSHTSRSGSPVSNRRPSNVTLPVQQSNQSQSEQPSQLPPKPLAHLLPIVPPPPVLPPSVPINPPAPAEDPVIQSQVPSSPTLANSSSIRRTPPFLQDTYDSCSSELSAPPPSYQHAIQSQPQTKSEGASPSNPALLTYARRTSEPNISNAQPEFTSSPSPKNSPNRSLDQPQQDRRPSVPETNLNRRLARGRPSGPAGPRKFVSGVVQPTRNSSFASFSGDYRSGNDHSSRKSSVHSLNQQRAIRLQTTPVRWQGIPMEVAKLSFSSQQLQDIVSRAIKQSAESSSIKFLKFETLDDELPEEMHRLEMQATDIKSKFKQSVIKRKGLVDALRHHVSGAELMEQGALNMLVEELQDVSATIERHADDLYHVTDQSAQLKQLRDVHSMSALSMALRKINTSFLRQATETQILREKVAALESERDVAWIHAEHVAHECDELMERSGKSTPAESSSRRSSQISAARKSSIRLSKAGLSWRTSTSAHRKSLSTQRLSFGSSSASRMVAQQVVPPVPPVPSPNRLPVLMQRNRSRSQGSLRSSAYHDVSPSAERALAQAQRELCEMLGIEVLDDIKTGRPRSSSMPDVRQDGPSVRSHHVRRNSDTPGAATGLDNYLDPISNTVRRKAS